LRINGYYSILHTYLKDWNRKGVRIVDDLVKENREFHSFEEFEKEYIINTNYLKYHGFIACLKKYFENLEIMFQKLSTHLCRGI
jgi:hypothetical protein